MFKHARAIRATATNHWSKLNLSYLSCLLVLLASNNFAQAGLFDWLTGAKNTVVETSVEHPVIAGSVAAASTVAGVVAIDRAVKHLLDRNDERASWGAILAAGTVVGLGVWYKLTSDREKILQAHVASGFAAVAKNGATIATGLEELANANRATTDVLTTAANGVQTNQAGIASAQTTAEKNLADTRQVCADVTELCQTTTETIGLTQQQVLLHLTSAGLSMRDALNLIKTNGLAGALKTLDEAQAGLGAGCDSIVARALAIKAQVERIERQRAAEQAELAELRRQLAATKGTSANPQAAPVGINTGEHKSN